MWSVSYSLYPYHYTTHDKHKIYLLVKPAPARLWDAPAFKNGTHEAIIKNRIKIKAVK